MILCIGSVNVDLAYRLPDLPKPGETLKALSFWRGLGGKGANQAVAAARAGANVTQVCPIGADARDLAAQIQESGVRFQGRILDGQANGHAVVLVSERTGENAITIYPGTNNGLTPDDITEACADLTPRDYVMLQNETNLTREAAQAARAKGCSVIYSAAPFDPEDVASVLPYVTHLLTNEIEADQLRASGLKLPADVAHIVTKGPNGVEWREAVEVIQQAAFAVKDVVDTTGAGDCFAGNLTAALSAGASPKDAMRWAQAASAIQITRPGAAPAMPTRDEVTAFLG